MATGTNGVSTVASKHISDELAANYDAIVADENTSTTYDDIAEMAAGQGDAQTAAWARDRAATKTEPEPVEPAPPVDYSKLKADDLKKIAEERQIPLDELKTKSDFVDALAAWDVAQPAPDRNAAAAVAQAAAS